MGEFEEKLNSILSSPKDMEKILGLARELGGGGEKSAPPPQEKEQEKESGAGFDPKLLSLLGKLMGEAKHADDGKTALIAAMKPYVREERREAMDRALKIAKLTHVARLAIQELGGDFDIGL